MTMFQHKFPLYCFHNDKCMIFIPLNCNVFCTWSHNCYEHEKLHYIFNSIVCLDREREKFVPCNFSFIIFQLRLLHMTELSMKLIFCKKFSGRCGKPYKHLQILFFTIFRNLLKISQVLWFFVIFVIYFETFLQIYSIPASPSFVKLLLLILLSKEKCAEKEELGKILKISKNRKN